MRFWNFGIKFSYVESLYYLYEDIFDWICKKNENFMFQNLRLYRKNLLQLLFHLNPKYAPRTRLKMYLRLKKYLSSVRKQDQFH